MAKKRKETAVRVRVTFDLDLGRFWEEDNTLEEIQERAENMVHNAMYDLKYDPQLVGKVSVILTGGSK